MVGMNLISIFHNWIASGSLVILLSYIYQVWSLTLREVAISFPTPRPLKYILHARSPSTFDWVSRVIRNAMWNYCKTQFPIRPTCYSLPIKTLLVFSLLCTASSIVHNHKISFTGITLLWDCSIKGWCLSITNIFLC